MVETRAQRVLMKLAAHLRHWYISSPVVYCTFVVLHDLETYSGVLV